MGMVAFTFILVLAIFAALGCFLLFNSILVFNTASYMAVAPDMLWHETRYARNLPNLLKCLYDAGCASPWPSRSTALSAWLFRRKLSKILRADFPKNSLLIQQHLSLWAFVQLHRVELKRIVRAWQVERARHILVESPSASTRQRVLNFLNHCKVMRASGEGKSRQLMRITDTPGWFIRLRNFDILLREHGYHMSKEFSILERWENAENDVILAEMLLSNSRPIEAAV
jgi:hypothetical protein